MKSKLLDLFLLLLALSLGVFFFKLVSGNIELGQKVTQQESQASILIDEIGETKQANQTLYEKLQKAEEKIGNLQTSISAGPIGASPPALSEPAKIPRPVKLPLLPNTKNFLLVGHNKRLADTIMLAAVNEEKSKITLVSIPRDLVVNGRKINEYLSLFSAKKLKEKIEEVAGLQIHGYAIIDFAAFETIVDTLGGVDIYVPAAIYDPLYPDGQGNYTLYSISAGSHHLNGAEALKYARSRHSTSDFDRAKRQQQILKAIQERILNFDILNRLDEVKGIFDALAQSFETNLGFFEMVDMAMKYGHFTLDGDHVISTENFLSSGTNIAGQYILLPRGGNFGKVQKWVREVIM